MKRLFTVFSIVVVLIAGLAIAPSFFNWDKYKAPALKQIEDMTGLNVAVNGDISLAILPSPRVYLEMVNVKDPSDQSGARDLASFEMLDVRVALMPLLSGNVAVQSVHLKKPQINISKNEQGRFNFMTPKIEAMMAGKSDDTNAQTNKKKAELSFDAISIEDGALNFTDAAAKAPIVLSKVNLDIDAKTLQGPFNLNGDMVYNGQNVEIKAKTGAIDAVAKTTSLNLDGKMAGIDLDYNGVVQLGDAPEIQGEMALVIASLNDVMKREASTSNALGGALKIKGLITANAKQVTLKDADLNIAGTSLSGALQANLSTPITVKGAFIGKDTIDLDKFKAGSSDAKESQFDPASLASFLPKTLEIPTLGSVDVALNAPGVIINGQMLKDVGIKITNSDRSFALSFDAGSIPGQGQIAAKGALSYAEKSHSDKTNKDIYSNPSATFSLKGQSENFPQTIEAFSGLKGLPLVKDSKRGVFDLNGQILSSGLIVEKAVLNLDKAAFSASGSWKAQKDSARSLLKAAVVAESLNFDTLSNGSNEPKSSDPLKPLKELSLPYDVDVDVSVNNAIIQGYSISGLKAEAIITPNNLKVNKIAATNFAGASFDFSGAIANLKELSGLNIGGSLTASDPYKFANAFKIDSKSWPQNLGSTKIDFKGSGSVNAMDINAGVSALGGSINVDGRVSNPMTKLEIGALGVHVKHPNMNNALQSFAKGAPSYASLAKPMDFKANIALNGKVIDIKDINADLAGASTSGTLKIDSSAVKPVINGNLRIGDLKLVSGGSSAAQANASTTSGAGKWSTVPMNSAWLHSFNADLDIAANSIVYETWNLSKPSIKVTIKDGTMDINSLNAGLYDGQIAMNGVVSSNASDKPLNVKTTVKITDINLGSLASALSGTRRIDASGDVSLDFDVSGAGGTQKALISALNGSANLSGNKVVMKGFDLAGLAGALMESNKPLPRLQELLTASTNGGETAFDSIRGSYTVQNGVVGISSMKMDGPEAAIVSTGRVDLPAWYIDTNHTVTLKNAQGVEPFGVAIQGSLSNPKNTFGSGLFDTFLRQKLQSKLTDKLPDLIGEDVTDKLSKFGILPQKKVAPVVDSSSGAGATEPASGEIVNDNAVAQPAAEAQPQPQRIENMKPEEVVNDLLKGFLR